MDRAVEGLIALGLASLYDTGTITTSLLPPSVFIIGDFRNAAQRFINENFGQEPFLAAHVRPYPDTCMTSWAKPGKLSLATLAPRCAMLSSFLIKHLSPVFYLQFIICIT